MIVASHWPVAQSTILIPWSAAHNVPFWCQTATDRWCWSRPTFRCPWCRIGYPSCGSSLSAAAGAGCWTKMMMTVCDGRFRVLVQSASFLSRAAAAVGAPDCRAFVLCWRMSVDEFVASANSPALAGKALPGSPSVLANDNPSRCSWWRLDSTNSSMDVLHTTSPPTKRLRTTKHPTLMWIFGTQSPPVQSIEPESFHRASCTRHSRSRFLATIRNLQSCRWAKH